MKGDWDGQSRVTFLARYRKNNFPKWTAYSSVYPEFPRRGSLFAPGSSFHRLITLHHEKVAVFTG